MELDLFMNSTVSSKSKFYEIEIANTKEVGQRGKKWEFSNF